jgi:hypothetical protein
MCFVYKGVGWSIQGTNDEGREKRKYSLQITANHQPSTINRQPSTVNQQPPTGFLKTSMVLNFSTIKADVAALDRTLKFYKISWQLMQIIQMSGASPYYAWGVSISNPTILWQPSKKGIPHSISHFIYLSNREA